ncbi:hypothetical protein [Thalassotalea sediminis]|uniref:hypothetical protein n=1 Tax=Thalassotalea sediminis TaxID=1759089 RepID=UPI00257259CF|nr:hypothetical protein [Thalassotalea sediminis]
MSKSTVKQMQEAEVKKSLKKMSKGSLAIRKALTFMKLGQAHIAYDCDSFKDFIKKIVVPEIDYSYDTCNDQANAGEIEYNVGGKEFIGTNSYSALEPLIRAKLEPAKQKEVFQHIVEETGVANLTGLTKKTVSKKSMEKALVDLDYIDPPECEHSDKGSGGTNSSNNDNEGNGSELEKEVIGCFNSALICWARNQECVDDTIFVDFIETATKLLSEDPDEIEDVICGAIVESFCNVDKENLSKLVIESLPRPSIKKLIKQFNY